jgi:hypothetical protein
MTASCVAEPSRQEPIVADQRLLHGWSGAKTTDMSVTDASKGISQRCKAVTLVDLEQEGRELLVLIGYPRNACASPCLSSFAFSTASMTLHFRELQPHALPITAFQLTESFISQPCSTGVDIM